MTDPWLVDALRDMRNIAAMCDSEAYPALKAWLDRWQLAQEDGPTMGDLLGDPEWDKREVRLAMIRLRANIRHEYAGKAKILAWHANQMRREVARLRADYPAACQEMEAELTAVDLEAQARAEQLEERVRVLPTRRRKPLPNPSE